MGRTAFSRSTAPGVGDEVPQAGAGRSGGGPGAGSDPGDLRGSDVLIIKGHVSKDHVHLLVSIPPQVTISRLVQRLKGKTAYKLLQEFAQMRKEFWGRHLWARGTSAAAAGT